MFPLLTSCRCLARLICSLSGCLETTGSTAPVIGALWCRPVPTLMCNRRHGLGPQDKDSLYFVMDYIPGGDLMSLLIKFGIFEEPLARFVKALANESDVTEH